MPGRDRDFTGILRKGSQDDDSDLELPQRSLAWPNRIDFERGIMEPETEKGLTKKGIAFLEEMERLGMIIDVSHLGDAGFFEVAEHTKRPFIASHSNARGAAGNVRNLTDR